MLWCLNHVSNRRDATVRRGAQVKALAICSRYRFIHVWKPMLSSFWSMLEASW